MPTNLFLHAQDAVEHWKRQADTARKRSRELRLMVAAQCERSRQLEARVAGLEAELKEARARLGEQRAGPPAYVPSRTHMPSQRAKQVYRRVMRQRNAERARLVPVLRSIVQQLAAA